jgi:hypothetical protein
MKKINRREYLTRMGTGLLAVGSIPSLLAVDSESQYAKSPITSKAKRATSRSGAPILVKPYELWPVKTTLLPSPEIRVFFWGLMAFGYKGAGVAEIGIYTESAAHRFEVRVFEDQDCKPTYETPTGGYPNGSVFELGIDGRPSDVRFYHATVDFDRKNNARAWRQDFRWLPDFESDEFYNGKLPIDETFYKKRLVIKHGTFLTHLRTESRFDILRGPKPKRDVYWARVIGLQLTLQRQEQLTLRLPEKPLHFGAGKLVEIHFVNQCFDGPNPCEHSDHHLNFEPTRISGNDRFELKLKRRKVGLPSGTCSSLGPRFFNTDDAPCMGAGFGQGGFPPS